MWKISCLQTMQLELFWPTLPATNGDGDTEIKNLSFWSIKYLSIPYRHHLGSAAIFHYIELDDTEWLSLQPPAQVHCVMNVFIYFIYLFVYFFYLLCVKSSFQLNS